MNRVTKIGAVSILVALMLSIISMNYYQADALQTVPSVIIKISKESYKADVHPDSDGLIEINGTASFVGDWPEGSSQIVVSLKGDAGGWNVDPLDDITLTSSNKEKVFSTFLHVPQRTSSDHQGSITILGNWTTDADSVAKDVISDSATITIDQFYDYSISSENLKGTVNAGEGTGFKLTIFNEGNGHDRIRILILDHVNHTDEGLTIRVSQDKFQISEKSNRTFSLTINTTNITTIGYHSILVGIISAQAESLGYQPEMKELELNLTVKSSDFDRDGYEDDIDDFPYDPYEWNDEDGDGIGDNSDAFPLDPSASIDRDSDGYPDVWNPGMTEMDSTHGLVLDDDPYNKEKLVIKEEEDHDLIIMLIISIILVIFVATTIILMNKNRKIDRDSRLLRTYRKDLLNNDLKEDERLSELRREQLLENKREEESISNETYEEIKNILSEREG